MPRSPSTHLYIGIKSSVIALNRKTGALVWATQLPVRYKSSASLVNVFRDAEGLFATCAGELFALDPSDGSILWREPLKGFGMGFVSVASDLGSTTPVGAIAAALQAQAAAAAAAG